MQSHHTTNPYTYKQTNPPLQQALAPSLKGTVYKAMASCETISGVYKSAMAQVTCTMEYGICTLGLRPQEDILLPSGTNPYN